MLTRLPWCRRPPATSVGAGRAAGPLSVLEFQVGDAVPDWLARPNPASAPALTWALPVSVALQDGLPVVSTPWPAASLTDLIRAESGAIVVGSTELLFVVRGLSLFNLGTVIQLAPAPRPCGGSLADLLSAAVKPAIPRALLEVLSADAARAPENLDELRTIAANWGLPSIADEPQAELCRRFSEFLAQGLPAVDGAAIQAGFWPEVAGSA